MTTESAYPIPTYRYLVTVGDDEMAFNSVSGLELIVENIEYKDGTTLNISLKRGIVVKQSQLYDWFSSIQFNQIDKKDISISLTNETGSELLVTWNVANAFLTKLTIPGFEATSNDVSIEELCLRADNVTVTFH